MTEEVETVPQISLGPAPDTNDVDAQPEPAANASPEPQDGVAPRPYDVLRNALVDHPNAETIRLPRAVAQAIARHYGALIGETPIQNPLEVIEIIAQHESQSRAKLLSLLGLMIRVIDGNARELDAVKSQMEGANRGEAKAENAPAAEAQSTT